MAEHNQIPAHEIADHLENTETPAPVLHQIAKQQPGHDEYSAIAAHPNTSTETLQHIHNTADTHIKDPEKAEEVKFEAAAHPNAHKSQVQWALNSGYGPKAYAHEPGEKRHGYQSLDGNAAIMTHPSLSPAEVHANVKEALGHAETTQEHNKLFSGEPEPFDDSHRELVDQWMKRKDVPHEHVMEMVQHPEPKFALAAARSPSATKEAQEAYVRRQDIGDGHAKELIQKNPTAHPDVIRALHERTKGELPDTTDRYNREELQDQVARHPNTPKDVIQEIVDQGPQDRGYSSEVSARGWALAHPTVSKDKVHELAMAGDQDAHEAALKREDTDPTTLAHLENNLPDGYRKESQHAKIIQHPNYPEHEMLKRAKGSADEARALLGRSDVPESVLKELVNHKNKNVALDALKHEDVTPEVVQTAYKRKMADVSRAASQHHLATPEMQMERVGKDPQAAVELAAKSQDPKLLAKLHEAHPEHQDLHKQLINNKATDSDTLASVLKNLPANTGDQYEDRQYMGRLATHPNLGPKERKSLMQNPEHAFGAATNPSTTADELKAGLEHWKNSDHERASDVKEGVANAAFKHGNLTPEIAKDLLSGKYGQVGGRYNDTGHIAAHPAFTNDVVKHGLGVQSELIDPNVTKALASHPSLTEDDIRQQVSALPKFNSRMSDDQVRNTSAKLKGFVGHENVPHEVLDNALQAKPGYDTDGVLSEALGNEKVGKPELEKFYKNYVTPTSDHNLEHNELETFRNKARDLGLQHDVAKNASSAKLVNSVVQGRYGGGPDHEVLKEALKNPSASVVASVLHNSVEPQFKGRGRGGKAVERDNPELRKVVDQLADHPNGEIVSRALPFMSAEGQAKAASKVDNTDPDVIRGLRPDVVSQMGIHKDLPTESIQAILGHKGRTPEHLEQAVEHSPDGARMVLNRIHGDDKSAKEFDAATKEKLELAALKHHGDSSLVSRQVADNTKSPKVLGEMMNDPKKYGKHIETIAENPKIKTADLDKLMSNSGDGFRDAFQAAARSKKASSELLHHISKQDPQLSMEIANHPKAASAKVLKQILENANSPELNKEGNLRGNLTKANLVNNPKVPQGIKDELLKDPKVLFAAKPENVTSEQLEQFATDKDPQILENVTKHPAASSEVITKAVDHALKSYDHSKADESSEHSDLKQAILNAAHHENLDEDTAKKISAVDPNFAAVVIDNHGPKLSAEGLNQMMDMHSQDGKLDQEVARAVLMHGRELKPKSIPHLIDRLDLDQTIHGVPATGRLADVLRENQSTAPEHADMALAKLQAARGKDFKYDSKARDSQSHADADLLRAIAENGSSQTTELLAQKPGLQDSLLKNDNLSPAGYEKVVDHLVGDKIRDFDSINDAVKHPAATTGTLEKIYKAVENHDDESHYDVLRSLAASQKSKPEMLHKLAFSHGIDRALSNPALGQEGTAKALSKLTGEYTRNHDESLKKLASNPNFNLKMMDDMKDGNTNFNKGDIDENAIGAIFSGVVKNPNASSSDMEYMYDNKDMIKPFRYMARSMVKHPATPEHVVNKMLENKEINEEDAYSSPSVGGKLWRAKKHEFPSLPGLEKGKEINEAVFRPREEKVKKVMSMIPAGGHLEWGQWKKENPSLAGDPLVQKLFTTAPKTRLTKEHAEKYLNEMPSKKFHVSYQKWDGAQRHNKARQLVVNINNHDSISQALKDDPKMHALYSFVQEAAQNSGHPINPQSIGWARTDTSNPDHWVIDEVQSDFNAMLSQEINKIEEQGQSRNLQEKWGLTPDEAKAATEKLMAVIQGWEKALVSNVVETAKAHGAKNVSMHSGKSKADLLNEMGMRGDVGVSNKLEKIYDRTPSDLGFQQTLKYKDLPNAGNWNKIQDHPIWTLDLNGGQPEPVKEPESTQTQPKQSLPKGA